MALEFSKCPVCGNVDDFAVSTDERIGASSYLTLTLGEDGTLHRVKVDETDVFWKTTRVFGYSADCCGETLPAEYRDELDRVLEIEREKD